MWPIGETSPVAPQTVTSLHLEATVTLTRALGIGVAGFRVGGDSLATYRGIAVIVQLGKLR